MRPMLCRVMEMDVRRMLDALRPQVDPLPGIAELVDSARLEWQAAQTQFNEVREAELVDYAIYRLQAAERHYIHLLREASREGKRSIGEGATIDLAQG